MSAATIKPMRRPPRIVGDAILHRARKGRGGNCYQYAFQEAMRWADAGSPAPEMRIVHGETVFATAARGGHAWIERGGVAYDWQTLAIHEGGPMPVPDFYAKHGATATNVYTPREVALQAHAQKHYGPWTDETTTKKR